MEMPQRLAGGLRLRDQCAWLRGKGERGEGRTLFVSWLPLVRLP